MPKPINAEYARKTRLAAQMADAAWLANGLDGMRDELRSLRRTGADEVVIAEVDRLYRAQCMRVLPEQLLAA